MYFINVRLQRFRRFRFLTLLPSSKGVVGVCGTWSLHICQNILFTLLLLAMSSSGSRMEKQGIWRSHSKDKSCGSCNPQQFRAFTYDTITAFTVL